MLWSGYSRQLYPLWGTSSRRIPLEPPANQNIARDAFFVKDIKGIEFIGMENKNKKLQEKIIRLKNTDNKYYSIGILNQEKGKTPNRVLRDNGTWGEFKTFKTAE